MKAIQVKHTGGPEAIELVELPVPARKRTKGREACGFRNQFHRCLSSRRPLQSAFAVYAGTGGRGLVTAVGEEVNRSKVGRSRGVALLMGAYAEFAAVAAEKLVPIPKGVRNGCGRGDSQGMTAHYLCMIRIRSSAGRRR